MPIASPCVRNCCLDKNDICLGCGRSVDEVVRWGEISDKEKLEILIVSKKRLLERNDKLRYKTK